MYKSKKSSEWHFYGYFWAKLLEPHISLSLSHPRLSHSSCNVFYVISVTFHIFLRCFHVVTSSEDAFVLLWLWPFRFVVCFTLFLSCYVCHVWYELMDNPRSLLVYAFLSHPFRLKSVLMLGRQSIIINNSKHKRKTEARSLFLKCKW